MVLNQLALIPVKTAMTNNANLFLLNIVKFSLPLSLPNGNCFNK
jgi:hypothetical protein